MVVFSKIDAAATPTAKTNPRENMPTIIRVLTGDFLKVANVLRNSRRMNAGSASSSLDRSQKKETERRSKANASGGLKYRPQSSQWNPSVKDQPNQID